jgi:hypothetical protein
MIQVQGFAWRLIAEMLAGKTWPPEVRALDLEWWETQPTRPGRRVLAKRWGCTEAAVRKQLTPTPRPPHAHPTPTPARKNLDNEAGSAHPTPTPRPPHAQSNGPAWLVKMRKQTPRPPRQYTNDRVMHMLVVSVREIRQSNRVPSTTSPAAYRPVWRLWQAMGFPAPMEMEAAIELLASAARQCPDPVFSRDIRAEGWKEGKDRSRNVASVCRLEPKEGSSGADWTQRMETAQDWHDAGRPTTTTTKALTLLEMVEGDDRPHHHREIFDAPFA